MSFGQRVWNENDFVGPGQVSFRTDKDIFHEICEALSDNPRIDASKIEVEIFEGQVFLRGKVLARTDKREVQRCLEYIPGVKDIINELHYDY